MVPRVDPDLAADFVRRFADFWRAPAPERLDTVVASDAVLSAPMTPTTQGLEAGKRAFAELFELIEHMTADVRSWGITSDGVLIEFTAHGTLGGAPISWVGVDRFALDEHGLAIRRWTYFDAFPLVVAGARRPRAWPTLLRTRIRQIVR
jgi:hypothetical protein